jgi:hypothetical protein|tara:strand:- start:3315 stop:3518 length:204 start_codon:yes stop_codon:yes gene_type:complete
MNNDINEQSLSEYLGNRLRTLMNEHTDHLATGNIKDFSDYKRMVGIIEGLALAEREMLDWIEQHTRQ